VPKFALQSTSSSSTVGVTLVAGTLAAEAVDGVSRFTLTLNTQDMDAIKVKTQLATTLSNAFLTMQDMVMTDMAAPRVALYGSFIARTRGLEGPVQISYGISYEDAAGIRAGIRADRGAGLWNHCRRDPPTSPQRLQSR
jgi:hypothetical protein